MGFFSWLKTSEKAIDVGTDLVREVPKAIDALFFTAEEKSQASLKAIELWLETQKVIRDENTARSLTRRILAVIILGSTVALIFAAAVLYKFDKEWAMFIISLIKEHGFMTGAVTVFYFGYYGFKQIVGEKK